MYDVGMRDKAKALFIEAIDTMVEQPDGYFASRLSVEEKRRYAEVIDLIIDTVKQERMIESGIGSDM